MVVHVVGEVDLAGVHILVDCLTVVEKQLQAPGPLVINLTDVLFLGSAGLTALIGSQKRCQNTGIDLRVVTGTHNIARTITLTGLGEVLTLFDPLADALGAAP